MNNEESKKNEHIRICPHCKQEYSTKIGLGNWKNLFRRPTLEEWIMLFIIILVIFAAYAYSKETGLCRTMLKDMNTTCMNYCNNSILTPFINSSTIDNNFTVPISK